VTKLAAGNQKADWRAKSLARATTRCGEGDSTPSSPFTEPSKQYLAEYDGGDDDAIRSEPEVFVTNALRVGNAAAEVK
jgi:hypothetical protein